MEQDAQVTADTGELLTISEAARLTRLSVSTLYSYACARRVPSVKLGGKLLFKRSRLIAWVDEHAREPVSIARAGAVSSSMGRGERFKDPTE